MNCYGETEFEERRPCFQGNVPAEILRGIFSGGKYKIDNNLPNENNYCFFRYQYTSRKMSIFNYAVIVNGKDFKIFAGKAVIHRQRLII